jgi:hypothetical protein
LSSFVPGLSFFVPQAESANSANSANVESWRSRHLGPMLSGT